MSSFALDSSNLIDNHNYFALGINIIANIVLPIGALITGKSIMSYFITN